MNNYISVTELTSKIKKNFEENFGEIYLEGEISNFKAHYSGHWYFTLKDANAQISCTMWKGLNSFVKFTPEDGMNVLIHGKITVYPPRGNYQLDVRSMKQAGVGDLQQAFEELKNKLAAEGLFDKDKKKPIPKFPKKIGIVTASGAAALKDMISVASRRYPLAELHFAPAKVQGEGAAYEIKKSIEFLNKKGECDLIIVGRGGGSLEDLWAFNEEVVARAIYNSEIPIISGVGHEIDFTIADFVADLRAETPTGAMEVATPDMSEILGFIDEFSYNANMNLTSLIKKNNQKLDTVINSYGFRNPENRLRQFEQTIDSSVYKMESLIDKKLTAVKNFIDITVKVLQSADKTKILKKGYTLIKQNDKFIVRAEFFDKSEKFEIEFYDKKVGINE